MYFLRPQLGEGLGNVVFGHAAVAAVESVSQAAEQATQAGDRHQW